MLQFQAVLFDQDKKNLLLLLLPLAGHMMNVSLLFGPNLIVHDLKYHQLLISSSFLHSQDYISSCVACIAYFQLKPGLPAAISPRMPPGMLFLAL